MFPEAATGGSVNIVELSIFFLQVGPGPTPQAVEWCETPK